MQYTMCYTITSASSCWHSIHWPYFVGAMELLPIELISFDARPSGNEIVLSWTVADPEAALYVVERSADGVSFESLGEVYAGGTSHRFTDDRPMQGTNYYRLLMIDADGHSAYSHIVRVNFYHGLDLQLIAVYNIQGVPVAFVNDASLLEDRMRQLPRGMYLARYHFSNGLVETSRVVN